ncbi:hypothetical protein [Robiginitalea sediminis]|uniref:hypothetical protein n=1 Tax=Robiginitalea sediminis TaxID=1982593 RepID=UPI000B4AF10B|nr:hypothetical protein [Robiginitalea sediminis]
MLRACSIVLSALLLLQSLHLSFQDLAQLDDLLEHARYHKEQFGDNLVTFISKHYGDLKEDHNQNHQEEREQHERLPFQQHLQLCISPVFLVKHLDLELQTSQESTRNNDRNFHYLLSGSAAFTPGVFQPPRQA